MMQLEIKPSGEACGADVSGVNLSEPLDPQTVAAIRAAWLEHHVLSFADQAMSDDDLERFTLYFGPFGEDPYIAPINGREHVISVQRDADETVPIFAETWHADWSFHSNPPAGTCLYGIEIPPIGGDTLFVNQHAALEAMPESLRSKLEGKTAIHTGRSAYTREGTYGTMDKGRSMDIRISETAAQMQAHDLIYVHPETGRAAIYGAPGYIVGLEGVEEEEAGALLGELYRWQTRPQFQYRHKWQAGMLLMWDNRSLLHMATGGYHGHNRRLHRTTIGALRAA